MICDHDCSCCEVLCSDAIEKNNKAINSQIEKIQSLEQEVSRLKEENQNLLNFRILDNERLSKKVLSLEDENKRLKEENLKLKSCHNCKFPIFDYGEMDCHKKDKSFYDKYDFLYCDNWEIEK